MNLNRTDGSLAGSELPVPVLNRRVMVRSLHFLHFFLSCSLSLFLSRLLRSSSLLSPSPSLSLFSLILNVDHGRKWRLEWKKRRWKKRRHILDLKISNLNIFNETAVGLFVKIYVRFCFGSMIYSSWFLNFWISSHFFVRFLHFFLANYTIFCLFFDFLLNIEMFSGKISWMFDTIDTNSANSAICGWFLNDIFCDVGRILRF